MLQGNVYKSILNNAPVGYLLLRVLYDSEGMPCDGEFLEVNSYYEQITGLAAEEIIGKKGSHIARGNVGANFDWFAFYSKVATVGSAEVPKLYSVGTKRWYRGSAYLLDGEYIVSFLNDISEEERQLEEYKSKIATLKDIVFELDGDYTFLDVWSFDESTLFMPRKAFINKKLEDVIPSDVANQFLGAFKQATQENGPVYIDYPSIIPGDEHWYGAKVVYSHLGEKKGRFTVVISDITVRKMAEQAIYHEKERLKITLQSIGDGVIATDKDGKVTLLNPVAEKLTGWTQEEASGRKMEEVFNIFSEITGLTCENPVQKVLSTGRTIDLANHTMLVARDGTQCAIADSAAPIRDQQGNIQGVVMVFRDATDERQKQDEIAYISYHDGLTGIYNRRFFEEELKRLDTSRTLPLSIIMGDLNGLKLINDVFGHQEGDKLLKSAVGCIQAACRQEDIIARWGGDEFIVLLPNTSEEEAQQVCNRITCVCGKESPSHVETSISLGYATKNIPEQHVMEVLKSAEDLMYQHKLLEARSRRSTIVASIKKSLYEKSHETEEHAERLKEMCKKMCFAYGLSDMHISEMELFAVLHDIGKIGVSDAILNKPGKLTEEEWKEMRRHPEIGFRIAHSSPELSQIAEYILAHHERWDGKGYPRELAGEKIPLLSRILAVVDAFDAMTSDRPYRKALTTENAVQELIKNSGSQFDPNIVNIFIEKVLTLGEAQ